MEILQKLNDQGPHYILVTHEMDTANHAKRIIRVKDGKLLPTKKSKTGHADGW